MLCMERSGVCSNVYFIREDAAIGVEALGVMVPGALWKSREFILSKVQEVWKVQ